MNLVIAISCAIFVIASPCDSKAKQSKSREFKRKIKSMTQKRIDKLLHLESNHRFAQSKRFIQDSKVTEMDYFVVFASLKLPCNDGVSGFNFAISRESIF